MMPSGSRRSGRFFSAAMLPCKKLSRTRRLRAPDCVRPQPGPPANAIPTPGSDRRECRPTRVPGGNGRTVPENGDVSRRSPAGLLTQFGRSPPSGKCGKGGQSEPRTRNPVQRRRGCPQAFHAFESSKTPAVRKPKRNDRNCQWTPGATEYPAPRIEQAERPPAVQNALNPDNRLTR